MAEADAAVAEVLPEHFESLERQAKTARFGMWVFVASETLLFGGLFALYASYRRALPDAFHAGVRHNNELWGTLNTLILILSSFLVAAAVEEFRRSQVKRAPWFLLGAVLLGLGFLGVKAHEYSVHIHEGILPGGHGAHFQSAETLRQAPFFSLYYLMTGLHALHVLVGLGVLSWLIWRIRRRRLSSHALEVGGIYWHLVDAIWIFLWPLFYLMHGVIR